MSRSHQLHCGHLQVALQVLESLGVQAGGQHRRNLHEGKRATALHTHGFGGTSLQWQTNKTNRVSVAILKANWNKIAPLSKNNTNIHKQWNTQKTECYKMKKSVADCAARTCASLGWILISLISQRETQALLRESQSRSWAEGRRGVSVYSYIETGGRTAPYTLIIVECDFVAVTVADMTE